MLRGLTTKSAEQIPDESFRLPVIFEDEHLLAVNKPAGLLSVPGKKNMPSAAAMLGPDFFPVHRLDMDTSGVLLFAKSGRVHQKMQKMFLRKEVKKQYTALLEGIFPGEREGSVSLPLRTDLNDRPRQMVCTESGKPALTRYHVVSAENGRTRIHFFPVTGRTHQLRVHAAHPLGLNIPIAGDRLYGKKAERLFLHAEKLEFPHPITGKITIISAEPDF
jgi:tRNA pseudouridine32 synthase/23S rRNA pseudouridine746 synthase